MYAHFVIVSPFGKQNSFPFLWATSYNGKVRKQAPLKPFPSPSTRSSYCVSIEIVQLSNIWTPFPFRGREENGALVNFPFGLSRQTK